ncbi:MAG: hypothetical protein IBX68_10325 [Dehalococcoidia bacterium]|nr:hypothetical protein [Dehalococcoidia bacterium]
MVKPSRKGSSAEIKRALESGRLFVADHDGYRRFIYSRCPNDGNDAPVYRQDRSGQAYTRLVFRCPICGTEFESPVKSMFLR